jgi:hypothetical protein
VIFFSCAPFENAVIAIFMWTSIYSCYLQIIHFIKAYSAGFILFFLTHFFQGSNIIMNTLSNFLLLFFINWFILVFFNPLIKKWHFTWINLIRLCIFAFFFFV